MACLDFMGQELLEAIKESRVNGAISRAINSTFLALILEKIGPIGVGRFHTNLVVQLCV